MTRKKLFIIISIVLLLLVGSFGFLRFKKYARTVKDQHCLTTRISSRLFDFNDFNVIVQDGLNKNDFEITNLNSGNVIFKTSKSTKGISNKHGKCRFKLIYQDKEIYEFGHMKYNNWHTNNYELVISGDKNYIDPKLTIFGPDTVSEIYYKRLN